MKTADRDTNCRHSHTQTEFSPNISVREQNPRDFDTRVLFFGMKLKAGNISTHVRNSLDILTSTQKRF